MMAADRWLWKLLLAPASLVLVFGLIGLIYPYPYMDFYLGTTAGTSLEGLLQSNALLALLLEVIFRANGLSMTMSGILALFIIWFPFRRKERWSIYALIIVGLLGLIGEIVLEVMVL